jgi:hypothetical protein
LNSINVHILLDKPLSEDFVEAKTAIYEALRHGRAFMVHENLAPAKGFNYYYVSDEGWHLSMGEERPFEPGTLFIELPEEGEIRLIRDGIVETHRRGNHVSFRVEQKGVYRVEVYCHIFLFGWRPWIFSNPVYLR